MKRIGCLVVVCIVLAGLCYLFLRRDPAEEVIKFSNSKEIKHTYQAKEGVSNLVMRFDGKMDCDIRVILTSSKDKKIVQEFSIDKQELENYTIRTDWYNQDVQVMLKSECLDNDVTLRITSY